MPFKKGKSGNPGGTASNVGGYNIPQLCRLKSKEAIDTAVRIMNDKKAPAQAQLNAAEMILDRGFGKAISRSATEPDTKTALEMTREELERIASGRSEGTAEQVEGNGTIN